MKQIRIFLYSLRRLRQLIVRNLTLGRRLRVLRGIDVRACSELLQPVVEEFAKLLIRDGSLELFSSSGEKKLLVRTSLEESKKALEKLGSLQSQRFRMQELLAWAS